MRKHSTIAALALLVLCSGCASTGGAMKAKPNYYRSTLDTEFIAAVESQANASGARVTWVHPPRKPKRTPQPD